MNCHYLSVPYDTWLGAIWFVTGVLNWPAALAPASSRLSRLAEGRYKPSLYRSRAQPLRGYTSVNQGVRFVKLGSKNASVIDVCFFSLSLCLFKHHEIDRWWEEGARKGTVRNVGWLLCLEWPSIHCENHSERNQYNIQYVASISLIKKRDGWRLQAKQLYSMDYTGIRALAIKSRRLRADWEKREELCSQRAGLAPHFQRSHKQN